MQYQLGIGLCHRIREYAELEGIHRDMRVQLCPQEFHHHFKSTCSHSPKLPLWHFFFSFYFLWENKQTSKEPNQTLPIPHLRRRKQRPWSRQAVKGILALLFVANATGTGWFIYLLWGRTRSQSYSPACREMESCKRTRVPLARSSSRWDCAVCPPRCSFILDSYLFLHCINKKVSF